MSSQPSKSQTVKKSKNQVSEAHSANFWHRPLSKDSNWGFFGMLNWFLKSKNDFGIRKIQKGSEWKKLIFLVRTLKENQIFEPRIPYPKPDSIFSHNSGHLWEIMFNKLHQKVHWKNSYFSGENGYFFNFGAKFLKLLQPYGSKNIFPQTTHLRCPWV